jgi:hypothetical protein
MKKVLLIISHGTVLVLGFLAGIFVLPILTQPPSPDESAMVDIEVKALYSGEFDRDLRGSDLFHYGQGDFYLSPQYIGFRGTLAPGPDYQLYLSPKFVQNKAEFLANKATMQHIGQVRRFSNFLLAIPSSVNVADFNSVVIWCESFQKFITAGQYQ